MKPGFGLHGRANMNAIAGIIDLGTGWMQCTTTYKTWTITEGAGPAMRLWRSPKGSWIFCPENRSTGRHGLFRSRKPSSASDPSTGIGATSGTSKGFYIPFETWQGRRSRMASTAVLSSRYLFAKLGKSFPTLPACEGRSPRMHEFILTLSDEDFAGGKSRRPKAKPSPSR